MQRIVCCIFKHYITIFEDTLVFFIDSFSCYLSYGEFRIRRVRKIASRTIQEQIPILNDFPVSPCLQTRKEGPENLCPFFPQVVKQRTDIVTLRWGEHRFVDPFVLEMDIQVPQFVGDLPHNSKILSEPSGDLGREYLFHLAQRGRGAADGDPVIVEKFRIPVLRKVGFVDPDQRSPPCGGPGYGISPRLPGRHPPHPLRVAPDETSIPCRGHQTVPNGFCFCGEALQRIAGSGCPSPERGDLHSDAPPTAAGRYRSVV